MFDLLDTAFVLVFDFSFSCNDSDGVENISSLCTTFGFLPFVERIKPNELHWLDPKNYYAYVTFQNMNKSIQDHIQIQKPTISP